MEEYKDYAANISFVVSATGRSKTEARINLLNKLQFPGHQVMNLKVTVIDLPDDK